ncbi:HD-GYP domain-containing protein [Vogesella sp. LIG4]|uniref:HD-GYP domain-containing protein n=1 Tax=Vogesella sp. LIG4 TaxID=1192162 RepID=UPI0008200C9C|nr:HD domain-containing phosphohydrolase [Vogesella sp. LIG4]SCK25092.1 HD-GYP domain [Vogesella sp. LIG4]
MPEAIEHYRIEDEESFADFLYALNDYAPRAANLLHLLRQQPMDVAVQAELMRLFHTIKGDAGLCRLYFVEPLVHAVEDILARIKSGELLFGAALEQVVLLAVDRLELLIAELDSGRAVALRDFNQLTEALHPLGQLPPAQVDEAAWQLVKQLTGFVPQGQAGQQSVATPAQQADLDFFHSLGLQFEQRSALFQGRTERNLILAMACNRVAGMPIDSLQLEAAVYVHDVGMMFLPQELWLRQGRMSEDERVQLAAHPGWAADLLARMPGWDMAARIVREHHERPDGRGYPAGKPGGLICDGAKLLAIIDTFEAVILKHGQRQQARSLLRAVAEVNASEAQFDPKWIACFNQVVRELMQQGDALPHVR